MSSLKQRSSHIFKKPSLKRISLFNSIENTLPGSENKPTGSMVIESPREEPLSPNRPTSGELITLDLPNYNVTRDEAFSPLIRRNQPLLSYGSSSGPRSSKADTQTLSGRDYFTKGKQTDTEPRIIITPVVEELENLNFNSSSPNSVRTSPFSPKKGGMKKQLSFYLKTKIIGGGGNELVQSPGETKNVLDDPLTKKSAYASRFRSTRNESNRLLSIIARQAISGEHPAVAKIFNGALEKVNAQALRKARKEQSLNRRKKIIRFFRRLKASFRQLLEPWKPDSLLIILWDIMIMCLILVQSLLSSYIVCFLTPSELNTSQKIYVIDFVGDIIYLMKILSLFQTGYYHHGELCCERNSIVMHYLTTGFPLDLISIFSLLGRFLPETGLKYLILLTIIRIKKIPPLVSAIEDYFQFSREVSSFIRVAKLTIMICVLAHFCSCCLYMLGRWEEEGDNWIVNSQLDGRPAAEIYVASLYWSVTIMATVGFGDIAPRTVAERIFIVGIMIISSIIFGYILSTIGSLLLEISSFSSEAKETIRILIKYMSEKGLNKNTQTKIRRYLEFYLNRENTAKIEGDSIMKMLSPNLQEEIVREVNAKILCDTSVFSSNFRKKFLFYVSKDLMERTFGPEETIFYKDTDNDLSMYFVTSGKVELCIERCNASLQKLTKGFNFGSTSFFSGKPRDASAKSLEFTTVFQLKRDKFLDKLDSFPSEKETFFMIKDSINLYKNFKYLDLKCFLCESKEHIISHCPVLPFKLDREQIVKDYLEDEKEFMRTFKRRNRPVFHALLEIDHIQEAASQIQIGHQTEAISEQEAQEEFYGSNAGSYSSIDEILDRRIYDPKPLDYVADTIHMKFLDLSDGFRQPSILINTMTQISGPKRVRQKVGEIEMFMKNNYDPYYHNLNLDRVKNFEVYYPNNNIIKLMVEFEKTRLEKIVQMRLGVKAKHISPLLVKGFKLHERKNSTVNANINNLKPATPPKQRKRQSVQENVRRESVTRNPGDIVLYNSGTVASSSVARKSRQRFSSFKPSSGMGNQFLIPPSEGQKKFDPVSFAQKVGKLREKDLSTIREDNTDKYEKGSQSNLSVDGPIILKIQIETNKKEGAQGVSSNNNQRKLSNSEMEQLDFNSFLEEIKKPDSLNTTKNNAFPTRPKFSYQIEEGSEDSDSSVEDEPKLVDSQVAICSKLIQPFPGKSGDNSKASFSKIVTRTEFIDKEDGEDKEKSSEDLTTENKLFKIILQDRFAKEEKKVRAASEDNARDAKKVIEKYQLPRIFKKMTIHDDE